MLLMDSGSVISEKDIHEDTLCGKDPAKGVFYFGKFFILLILKRILLSDRGEIQD